jgi:hypothetical protein
MVAITDNGDQFFIFFSPHSVPSGISIQIPCPARSPAWLQPQRRQECSPTELANQHGIARSAVSQSIQALEKVRLVECLTPEEKMGRYYWTTDTGKKVLAIIEGNGE